VISELGSGVIDFKVGERVCGTIPWGVFSERVAVPVGELTRISDRIEMTTAAALVVTYGTSLYALRERANLQPGDSLLVLGAGGGVGLAAVEIGAALGARVVAAASSDEKLDAAKRAGAHEVIRYVADIGKFPLQKQLATELKGLAGPNGFNVIYDPVGGGYTDPALRSIAWEGRYLVVGFAAGEIPQVPLNLALLKGCQIVGVMWGGAWKRDPTIKHRVHSELMRMAAEGRIRPRVGALLPL
jgi:NADPH:quinone reductase